MNERRSRSANLERTGDVCDAALETLMLPEKNPNSKVLMTRAEAVIPGGVNSPVRAFRQVGGSPLFIERSDGAFLFDADNKKYIDYVGSWGPMILGHRSPVVLQAIEKALSRGTSFGAPTDLEVEFAELLVKHLPAVDMIRFVSSGTEATMSAIRLARAFTKRDLLIKFNGCYHGHADSLLVKAGSGLATFGIAGSPGVPDDIARLTISIEFNDLDLFTETVKQLGPEKVAAVIVEPVPGNMGLVLPRPGFLSGLRELCSKHGILLILDEVMSGFRVAFAGAQERFKIEGDLVTYGKVIGGGLPVGAFGGKKEIMSQLSPLGTVYQAGTLSGNPLAMAAGLATVKELLARPPYEKLEELAKKLCQGLIAAATKKGVPLTAVSCGSMFGFFFSSTAVNSFSDAQKCDTKSFTRFFWNMLERGIYLAPSAFEAGFLSTAHTDELISQTVKAAEESF